MFLFELAKADMFEKGSYTTGINHGSVLLLVAEQTVLSLRGAPRRSNPVK
jgi:hypothetical protein